MATLFRWLLRLTVGAILLGLAGFVLTWWFFARSLPDYDARTRVAGITAPVEIVRDHANVPHVFGRTDRDVFFALGYAHAQDRLWQMTMLRRTVQGRLSELFGQRTAESDVLMRRLDLYRAATASVEDQDGQTRTALDAYAAGVNAWVGEVNTGARGRGAPEMWLFNQPISPWQPADSVAILKLMAWQQSDHLQAEVLRARSSLVLEEDRLRDILPDVPGPGLTALPRYADLMPEIPQRFAAMDPDAPFDPLSASLPATLSGASNAWAAGPSRSATGATLLANDPHRLLTAPSIWYLARLELTSGGVIGATIPGIPLVLAGRSADLGWGITASFADDLDLYAEEVNPKNAAEYRTPEGWERFEARDSIVEIKDAAAVTLRLRRTANGPVLPPEQFALDTIRPRGHVMTLAWSGLSGDDTSMTAGLRLMQARSIEEAMRAGRLQVAPSQNLILADRNRIALKTVGAVPLRDPGHQSQGRMPTLGHVAENRWQGWLSYADLPETSEPAGGLVGNTNNKTVDRPFPEHLSYRWGDTQRIARWRGLMQSREVHTRDSFIEAQLDTVSPTARALLPIVGADLWFTGEPAAANTPERRRQRALELLGEWNGEMNEHLPEPLIYAAWMRALQERLIRDDLGPLANAYSHVEPLFLDRVFRDIDGASAWCDIRQSAAEESCADIARMSLDDALIWISETYGDNLDALRWGDAHEARQDHPVLGRVPFLNWFVNIRQSTSGGDNTLMRGLTDGRAPNPFHNVHAAGYRGVYDFADPDSSVFIISTGQSGHPLSRHYDDLGELWRRGEYIPMSLDPSLARGAAVGITQLIPAPQ
ncbi:penicillin acylase family protein [Limimaricola cinnabarinus]|uniref:Penicillin amidase family protein n=1 Tax=Limimaricola cinnabarinus LL-001 TaxID=1337093 RepID=U2YMI6_9RHOB|nr:penicillin acylase family protein [Limimaricola cinnabarinus]GAD56396.1 penicillin amidase family protein [Limimaricola cinnabarinus LL-001]